MFAPVQPDEVWLTYDPTRGGFFLEFCHRGPVAPHYNLFGSIMGANITNDLRVTCVDSFWDRGGVLLNALHHKPDESRDWNLHRKPVIALTDGLTRSNPFSVKQTATDFEIWFGSEPLSKFPTHHDPKLLISVWLAPERVSSLYIDPSDGKYEKPVVVGIRLGFSTLVAAYPLKSLSICVEDIK